MESNKLYEMHGNGSHWLCHIPDEYRGSAVHSKTVTIRFYSHSICYQIRQKSSTWILHALLSAARTTGGRRLYVRMAYRLPGATVLIAHANCGLVENKRKLPTSATSLLSCTFCTSFVCVLKDGWIYCSIRKKWEHFILCAANDNTFNERARRFSRTQRNAKEWMKVLRYGYRIPWKKKERGKQEKKQIL